MICSFTKPSTFFSSVSEIAGLEPNAVDRRVRVSLVCTDAGHVEGLDFVLGLLCVLINRSLSLIHIYLRRREGSGKGTNLRQLKTMWSEACQAHPSLNKNTHKI